MNKLNKLLDKYPVAIVVIFTLLMGAIAIGYELIPRMIEDSKIPITNINY